MDPQQFTDLAHQMQGNTFFLGGMLGVAILCVGVMALVLLVGGR